MGIRRFKVPPVEPAEIGQFGNAFHEFEIIVCAVLAEELVRICLGLESIVR